MKRLSYLVTIAALALMTSCGPKDADIQAKANEQLTAVPGATASVKDGVVTLSGEVTSDADKAAAESDVKGVKGVKSVVNNLTVRPVPVAAPPAPSGMMDQGVADAVKDYPGVSAEVRDGVIYVSGTITAERWRQLKMSLDALNPTKVDASGLTVK